MIKRALIIIVLIVAGGLVYRTIVYQGPFEGQVLNAITKEPIRNLDISYSYIVHKFSNGVDSPDPYIIKKFKVYTDQNGNYKIPRFLAFWIPVDFMRRQITIWFPAGDVRYQTHFAEEYYFERVDSTGFQDGYPIKIKPTFFKQKVDVLLIPKLKGSIEQCNLIEETFSKTKCASLKFLL